MNKILNPREIEKIYWKIDEIPAFVSELSLYEKQEVLKYTRELLHQDLKLIFELMHKNPDRGIEFWKQSLDSYPRNEKIIEILTEPNLGEPKVKHLLYETSNSLPGTDQQSLDDEAKPKKFEIEELEDIINTSNLTWTNAEINKIGETLRRNKEKFEENTRGKELEEFNKRYNEDYKEGEVKHIVKPNTPEEAFIQLKEGVAESFASLIKLKLERTYDTSSLIEIIKEEIGIIEGFIKEAGKVSVRNALKVKKNNSSFNSQGNICEYNDLLHEYSRIKNGFYNKHFCSYSNVHSPTSKVWALCFIYLPHLKSLYEETIDDSPLPDKEMEQAKDTKGKGPVSFEDIFVPSEWRKYIDALSKVDNPVLSDNLEFIGKAKKHKGVVCSWIRELQTIGFIRKGFNRLQLSVVLNNEIKNLDLGKDGKTLENPSYEYDKFYKKKLLEIIK